MFTVKRITFVSTAFMIGKCMDGISIKLHVYMYPALLYSSKQEYVLMKQNIYIAPIFL